MTKEQARQLGHALIAWSYGQQLEARDIHGDWKPFHPETYEKLNVDEDLEWRIAGFYLRPEDASVPNEPSCVAP